MVTTDNVVLYPAISLVIFISSLSCCNQISVGGITDLGTSECSTISASLTFPASSNPPDCQYTYILNLASANERNETKMGGDNICFSDI